MKRTLEQIKIRDTKSLFLAIKAFAGTGKTTVLKDFSEANLDKRILYIAYNNSTAKKARAIFPSNVECRTAHSLAYAKYGRILDKKLRRETSLPFKAETIRKLFGFKRTQQSIKLCKDLKKIIENFCFSDYAKIEDAIPFSNMSERRETISIFLNQLWDEMIDPDSKFPTIPDVYLKQYQLSLPKLDYDYILFDEVQDANPLILNLVLSQRSNGVKLILVGDDHQSIYLFRGAENALSKIKPDETLYLTKSFRFGQNIAYAANAILKSLKNETNSLEGYEEIDDIVGEIDKSKTFACISRTNSNLFMTAIAAYEKNMLIHFVGGFYNYNFKKILEIEKLFFGEKEKIRDSYIKGFIDFEDYKAVANYTNDKEMLYYIKVVEKYNGSLSEIIKGIKKAEATIENANIILSTVHKSKGLEFEQVVLANDFPNFVNSSGHMTLKSQSVDEVNILYVAATRAINVLKPNKQLSDVITYYQKNIDGKDIESIEQTQKNNKAFISNIKNKF